jgi:DNA-directed RNA polymerase subunit RPC12/RpoP
MAAEIEDSLWSRNLRLSIPRGRVTGGAANLLLLFSSSMSNVPAQAIVCPHCKKPFDGELLAEGSRHEGFKCPHCRLFVPAERANGDDDAPS